MEKRVDLFIKSYNRDFWLLTLSLATIKKNVTGYNNIVLLIPEKDKQDFETRYLPDRTLIYYVADEGVGWLRQQWYKMNAHKYSNADYIMYSDSDCFFDHPINLQDYIKDDKPEILCTSWDKVGDAIVWRNPTEYFIKEPVEFERMRRNNVFIHRSTLEGIEKYAPDLEKTIMGSHRFSEFNAISAWAFKYENEKYTWTNTDDWKYVPPLAIQVWSHSSKAVGASETHLREFIRILETIIISFGLPLPQ